MYNEITVISDSAEENEAFKKGLAVRLEGKELTLFPVGLTYKELVAVAEALGKLAVETAKTEEG